jgi:hypothetical protein
VPGLALGDLGHTSKGDEKIMIILIYTTTAVFLKKYSIIV